MADPLKLSLDLSLNDRLVGPLRRALADVKGELQSVQRDFTGIGRTGQEAERGLENVVRQARGLENLGRQARGVRDTAHSVKQLDDAVKNTERSTSRLAQTFSSARQAFSSARNIVRGVGGLVAGATAFTAVASGPVRRAADYDTQLRGLANTAYAGEPLETRRAGLARLDAGITRAVRAGGGNREQALATLNELVASGTMSVDQALGALPGLQRGGTASGADPVQLAQIAIRAQQTFKIPSDQIGRVIDMAMTSGQMGGFELRDMARWLPQQMAAGRSLGLSGTGGLAQLLAANQASVITAGSKDEAGNNLVNLLAKINSRELSDSFRRETGVDLTGSLTAANAKGVDSLTAFVNIVDKIVAGDRRFQAARAGAASADSEERRASFDAQADILQGSAIGRVLADRQALMALVGLMGNRQMVADVAQRTLGASGAVDGDFALMAEGAGYKFDQRAFEVQMAQTEAMASSNSVIAKLAEAQTDLYRRYPGFADALEGAKVAVTALAAAAAAAGAVTLLTKGAGGASTVASIAGLAGKGVAAAGGLAGLAKLAGGVGIAGAAGYGVGSLINKGIEGTAVAESIGKLVAKTLALLGNEEAQQALAADRQMEAADKLARAADKLATQRPFQLTLDGRELAVSADQWFSSQARRQ